MRVLALLVFLSGAGIATVAAMAEPARKLVYKPYLNIPLERARSWGVLRQSPDSPRGKLIMPHEFEVDGEGSVYFRMPAHPKSTLVKISSRSELLFKKELDFAPNHLVLLARSVVLFNDISPSQRGVFAVIGPGGELLKKFKKEIPRGRRLSRDLLMVGNRLIDDRGVVDLEGDGLALAPGEDAQDVDQTPEMAGLGARDALRRASKIDANYLGNDRAGYVYGVCQAANSVSDGKLRLAVAAPDGSLVFWGAVKGNAYEAPDPEGTIIFRKKPRLYQMWTSTAALNISELQLLAR